MDLRRKLRRKASPAFSDYADRLIAEPFSMKRDNLQGALHRRQISHDMVAFICSPKQ